MTDLTEAAPATGTGLTQFVRACDAPRPARTPLPPPPQQPAVAVALSGGGFRATLSGLGVLRFLADSGLLAQVRYSSSVSGGSVANGVFASRYDELAASGFTGEAFDRLVLRPVVQVVTRTSVQAGLLRQAWRLIGSTTRTDLLGRSFDRHWFGGRLLEELPADCQFIFNAANLTTGVRFTFEREVVGDYAVGHIPTAGTGLSVARAVATSAAVPGLFATVELPRLRFPCQGEHPVRLVDGGVYDNMALEAVDELPDALLVAINAGGLFPVARRGLPILHDLRLAQDSLYRQSTSLRRRWMVERFRAWEQATARNEDPPATGRRGVLFNLSTTVKPSQAWTQRHPRPPVPTEVAVIRTSFDRFSTAHSDALVHAGWWLTGATLTRYHPDLLDEIPTYRPVP